MGIPPHQPGGGHWNEFLAFSPSIYRRNIGISAASKNIVLFIVKRIRFTALVL